MNETSINAGELKEKVSLVTLLSSLGFEPQRTSGKELLYLSMIRDSDTKPSFAVNEQLGVWYDHGTGKGGNIIDFALAYWKLPFQEVLEKIMQVTGSPVTLSGPPSEARSRKRSPVKIPHYEVLEVKELANNPAITGYLKGRHIWEAAQGRLKEVYYYVEDQKKLRKHFFAAGWQNELGSWEVRNLYFKGCLGHKAISLVPGDEYRLAIFEGYINYLSWLTEHPLDNSSVLILNSISLLQTAICKAREYREVSVFFDHDLAGRGATMELKKAIPAAIDCAHHYLDFKDYNDRLIAAH